MSGHMAIQRCPHRCPHTGSCRTAIAAQLSTAVALLARVQQSCFGHDRGLAGAIGAMEAACAAWDGHEVALAPATTDSEADALRAAISAAEALRLRSAVMDAAVERLAALQSVAAELSRAVMRGGVDGWSAPTDGIAALNSAMAAHEGLARPPPSLSSLAATASAVLRLRETWARTDYVAAHELLQNCVELAPMRPLEGANDSGDRARVDVAVNAEAAFVRRLLELRESLDEWRRDLMLAVEKVGHMSKHVSIHMSEHMVEHMSEHVSEHMPENMSEHKSEHMPEHVSEHIFEHMSEHMSEHIPGHMSNHIPGHMSNHIPGHMSNHIPGHMSNHIPVAHFRNRCLTTCLYALLSHMFTGREG